MRFFNRKPQPEIKINPTATSRVEIEVAKNANQEVKEKATEINEKVKDLLVTNGFTLTIALAAHNSATSKSKGRNY